jgi:DNA-binding GntR family transcriptional regulator
MSEPLPTRANPGDTLRRDSLGSQIAARIREDILLGRLSAGTPVRQQSLCDLYGTSRMPIRDALRQLVTEGLLTHTDGGHTIVAAQRRTDIEDAFDIEAFVHGRTTERATKLMTDDDLKGLAEIQARMDAAASVGDMSAISSLNWSFHRDINLHARSNKLLAVIRVVALSMPREFLVEFPEWVDRGNREHSEIIEAMVLRDAVTAGDLMRKHILGVGDSLVAFFAAHELGEDDASLAATIAR